MSRQIQSTQSRWTEPEARAWLAKQRTSGLSAYAFAARQGIDPQRLYAWRRRLEVPESAAPRLVEVAASGAVPTPPTPSAAKADRPIELVTPDGFVLRIPPDADLQRVRALLGLVASC